jgi:hypothetical protein
MDIPSSSGVNPFSCSVGSWDLSPEVRRPGRESDHSSPAGAELKKTWIYKSPSLHTQENRIFTEGSR